MKDNKFKNCCSITFVYICSLALEKNGNIFPLNQSDGILEGSSVFNSYG